MVSSIVLVFLTLGVLFDITAMVCMVLGARGTPFTFHGLVGYIAFAVMLVEALWAWGIYYKKGLDAQVSEKFLMYTRLAYIIWVCGYITGSLIVLWR